MPGAPSMAPERPAVAVIVPALNSKATLGRTLDALAAQRLDQPYEIVVVDDGSTDGTRALAEQHAAGPTVVAHDTPQGPGSARNLGATVASAPVLAFTDSDCFPAPEWLARGLEEIERLDLLQGAVEPDPEASLGPFDRTIAVRGENGYYETANLFVRRELFDELGGFEEWIVAGGEGLLGSRPPRDGSPARPADRTTGEDVLFGWQARRRGARTGFSAAVLVHHAVFAKTPAEAIRYRWGYRHLPALPARIPEMRERTFYRRWFFDRRSAVFDAAALGIVVAVLLRRRAPLLAALPYAVTLGRDAAAWPQHGTVTVIAGRIGTDAMTLVALAAGSVAWRAPLI
jgi:glycosyltransferase involved in cell wall biosynthesis